MSRDPTPVYQSLSMSRDGAPAVPPLRRPVIIPSPSHSSTTPRKAVGNSESKQSALPGTYAAEPNTPSSKGSSFGNRPLSARRGETPLPRVASLSSPSSARSVSVAPSPVSGRLKPLPRIATLTRSKPDAVPVTKSFPRGAIAKNEFGEYEYVDSDGSLVVDKLLHQLEEVCCALKLQKLRDSALDGEAKSNVNGADEMSNSDASASTSASSTTSSTSISASPSSDDIPPPRLVILTLSGAFAPVHLAHLAMFDTAKAVLEAEHGCTVIAGFMSVSGDAYMRTKVYTERQHMPLEERAKMCKMTCKDSPYVDVCAYGWTSSDRVAEKLRHIVRTIIVDTPSLNAQLGNAVVDVIQLCGTNQALKNRLYTRGNYLAISRPNSLKRLIEDLNNAKARQDPFGSAHRFIAVDQDAEGFPYPGVPQHTSSYLRDLLFSVDRPKFEEMAQLGWLHPLVLEYLKKSVQRFGWLCRT